MLMYVGASTFGAFKDYCTTRENWATWGVVPRIDIYSEPNMGPSKVDSY